MIKLTKHIYNPEIAHCAGARRYVCKHCLRYALYETWKGFDPMQAESIILLAPRAEGYDCECLVKMPANYVRNRVATVAMKYTSRSGGVAI